jgi:predicted membrane protein
MVKRRLKFLGFALIFIIYMFLAQTIGNKRDKRNFKIFYNSEINGSITGVFIKNHGVGFRLKYDTIDYVFYPLTSPINQKKVFHLFADKGDSVIKPRNVDTLILIKDGKRYPYTFQVFK